MNLTLPLQVCPDCKGKGVVLEVLVRHETAFYCCTSCAGSGSIPDRPRIVVLCGSTRFASDQYLDAGGLNPFERAAFEESLQGKMVLTLGCPRKSDSTLFGHLPVSARDQILTQQRTLHLQKIAYADELLIVAPGGYYGEHTRAEIRYARALGKPIRLWEGG